MKRYGKIVLEAEKGIDYILESENGTLLVRAVLQKVSEVSADGFFSKITSKERDEANEWVKGQEFKTDPEKDFEKLLKEALKEVNYDYWISNIEPCVDETTGRLEFVENRPVAVGYSCNQLKEMCNAYYPKRGSRMATLYELFIWYAYRIVKGYWTLDFVANDSSSGGNYWNAPVAIHRIVKTGARLCGDFKDGQGNTYKVVTYKDRFVLVGGSYVDKGNWNPVSSVGWNVYPNLIRNDSSCVVVLTK